MARPLQRRMKSNVRAVVGWAESHGWSLQEGKDGNGHWVMRHPTGESVRIPDTPGDSRGLVNVKAEIRRKSGLPNDSGPAAKYRHEGRSNGFDMEAALKEQRLRRAYEEVRARQRYLDSHPDSTTE